MSEARATAASPEVTIRAEVSAADPDECRFVCSVPVHPGGPFAFANAGEAAGSPLPEHLFALGDVVHVQIAEQVVTVGKARGVEWGDLRRRIGAAIRAQLAAGVPAVLESAPDLDGRTADGVRDAAALTRIIERLFERELNPRVASHGGRITLVGIDGSTMRITMGGGCQGCSSSSVTLRDGVEVMVRRVAPEITEIIDVTDHAAGIAPYRKVPVTLGRTD
jgi:Fe-S cluster biogenesis protein NfuA